MVYAAPTTDSITQHLADGTASYQRAVYETGTLINDQIRSGAQRVYSGVSRWGNMMGNAVRTPFSFAANHMTSAFRRMPSPYVPQFVTSASETVQSIPAAVQNLPATVQSNIPAAVQNIQAAVQNIPSTVQNIPSAIGSGIWNTSSYTVNAFGRSLVIKGEAMERYAEFLKNSGRNIEDYQWVRVPKN